MGATGDNHHLPAPLLSSGQFLPSPAAPFGPEERDRNLPSLQVQRELWTACVTLDKLHHLSAAFPRLCARFVVLGMTSWIKQKDFENCQTILLI